MGREGNDDLRDGQPMRENGVGLRPLEESGSEVPSSGLMIRTPLKIQVQLSGCCSDCVGTIL